MTQQRVTEYVRANFPDVAVQVASKEDGAPEIAWGDSFFFYDPDPKTAKSKFPFATIVTKDYGDFDNRSNLNRAGVWRLNIGLSKAMFESLFPATHAETDDFTALDRIMPLPVYSPQHWACVLNPSADTFEQVKPLLADAYQQAVKLSGRKPAGR